MDRETFISELMTCPKELPIPMDEIINMSLAANDYKTKCLVIMEELAELSQQVSKYARDEGDIIGLVEEIADVTICLEQLRRLTKIDENDLDKAVAVKLIREYERRK